MGNRTYNVGTSGIRWEPEQSTIDESETGEITVSVVGSVDAGTGMGLEQALLLLPAALPVGVSGPVGVATRLANAKMATRGGSWDGSMWRLSATYKKAGSITSEFPDGRKQSTSDRAERRVIVSNEPIMTHPVALAFELKDKTKLAALLQGRVIANPNYDSEDEESAEFIDASSEATVTFSSTDVTAGALSGSPLDWARFIKADLTTYQRKTIRHCWNTTRDNPAPDSEYRSVGKVVESPPLAPSITGGFQWMLTGITDVTENGTTWNTTYEFDLSGSGGYIKQLYEGGSHDFA